MPTLTRDSYRHLALSLFLSIGLHAGGAVALCSFPNLSPPRLILALGDVSLDVKLVSRGEPSLGNGYADQGNGPGDGRLALKIKIVRSSTDDAEPAEPNVIASASNIASDWAEAVSESWMIEDTSTSDVLESVTSPPE